MTEYFRIYIALLKLNISRLLIYRTNFLLSAFDSLVWGVFQVSSMLLLTTRIKTINGWSRNELIILASSYSIVVGLFHVIFARNLDRFSQLINKGELDQLLLKPVSSQFLASFWFVNLATMSRVLGGLVFNFYLLNKLGMSVTFINILGFIVLTIFSLMLLYSIWFLATTLTFWFPQLSNLTELLYTLGNISRFPREVYQELKWYVFLFLLPYSLMVATPTKALINKALTGDFLMLLGFSVGLFILSKFFWRFALRFYTSAN